MFRKGGSILLEKGCSLFMSNKVCDISIATSSTADRNDFYPKCFSPDEEKRFRCYIIVDNDIPGTIQAAL